MSRKRLGVVVPVLPTVATEVDALRRALRDPTLGTIAPHVTLVPPVNVRGVDVDGAFSLVDRAAAHVGPFAVRLGPARTFWPANPTVYLAVTGAGTDRLAQLRSGVFAPPLARPLSRPFVPHVTIGEWEGPVEHLRSVVAAFAGFEATVDVDRVAVLEERRDGDGVRRWQPAHEAPLGGPAVVGRGGLGLEISETRGLPHDARALIDRVRALRDRDQFGEGATTPARQVALTARRDGEVLGVVLGCIRGGIALVRDVAVAPEHRRQGVGRHLLARFEAVARDERATALVARVTAGEPAAGFYRALGFVEEVGYPWTFGRNQQQLRRPLR